MTKDQTTLFIAEASSKAISAIGKGEEPLRVVEALSNKLSQLAAEIRNESRESLAPHGGRA